MQAHSSQVQEKSTGFKHFQVHASTVKHFQCAYHQIQVESFSCPLEKGKITLARRLAAQREAQGFLKVRNAELDGKGRIVEEYIFNGFMVEMSLGNSIFKE